MVHAYWEIGQRIMEEQGGKERAAYGRALVKELSRRLTQDFGRGFTETNLKYMRQFYLAFSKGHTLCDELSWSHYRALSRVSDPAARAWYEREAVKQGWSVRVLERNISTQYYHRLLQSQDDKKSMCRKKGGWISTENSVKSNGPSSSGRRSTNIRIPRRQRRSKRSRTARGERKTG